MVRDVESNGRGDKGGIPDPPRMADLAPRRKGRARQAATQRKPPRISRISRSGRRAGSRFEVPCWRRTAGTCPERPSSQTQSNPVKPKRKFDTGAPFHPKAELRSALQDASRGARTPGVPTGLGARARQRRFRSGPRTLPDATTRQSGALADRRFLAGSFLGKDEAAAPPKTSGQSSSSALPGRRRILSRAL